MSVTSPAWPSKPYQKQAPIVRKTLSILIPMATSVTCSTRKHIPEGNTRGSRWQDDWARIKDPKEKKRVQNRVAQRTYRNRVKARLLDLQAKVEAHERNEKELEKQIEHAQGFSTLVEPTPIAIDFLLKSPSSIMSADEQNFMQYSIGNPTDIAIHSDPIDTVTTIFEQLPPHYITNDPLTLSHTVFRSNGMISPRTKSASPNFTVNNLLFQKPPFTQSGHQQQIRQEYPKSGILGHSDHTPSVSPFNDPQSTGMDAIIYAYVNSWGREDLFSAQSPPESDLLRLPWAIQAVNSPLYASKDGVQAQEFGATSINISNCAAFGGLKSDGPSIDGLKEFGLLLSKENATARDSRLSKLRPLLESQDTSGRRCPRETIKAVKRLIQYEMPHSWALLKALASATNQQPWQQSQSNPALAAILLIELNGKISSKKLLEFIASFL